MHRDPETAELGNGISIYAFLYYVENYGPRRAIPRTRPTLTRNVRDNNLPQLVLLCSAALSFLFFMRCSRRRRPASLSFRHDENVTDCCVSLNVGVELDA